MNVSHVQTSEACEAVGGVKKKKKKVKKEKDVSVDTSESADLTESCTKEQCSGKKGKAHKSKVYSSNTLTHYH